jgi:hypothetical protein
VLRACDWLSPSSYDRYELASFTPDRWEQITAQETAWRENQSEICRRFNESSGLPPKPIIPMISTMFWKVGQMEYNMKQMPLEEMLRDQVVPLMAGGADGIAIWTGMSYWVRSATSTADLGPTQIDARYALTQDFLDGVEPSDWTDPTVKTFLEEATSLHVRQRIEEVKAHLETASPDSGTP